MRRLSLSAVIALALLLSACQSAPPEYPLNARVPAELVTEEVPEGEEGGVPEDAFVAVFTAGADLVYTDAPAEVPAGPVLVELDLTANANHNVVFEGIRGDAVLAEGSSVGQYLAESTISLDPGSYIYYCSVPTHREAGMEGSLTAVEGLTAAPAPADGEAPAEGEAPADGEAPAEGEAPADGEG